MEAPEETCLRFPFVEATQIEWDICGAGIHCCHLKAKKWISLRGKQEADFDE